MKISIRTILSIFVISGLSSQAIFAGPQPAPQTSATVEKIPLTLMISNDDAKEIYYNAGESSISAFINMVEAFGPKAPANTIFHWEKSTPRARVSEIILDLNTSFDLSVQSLPVGSDVRNDPTLDSFTLMMGTDKTAPVIVVSLLMDRIFYDEKRQPRPDGSVRFMSALAFELYGNVTTNLLAGVTNPPKFPTDPKGIAQMHVRSYQASILYLETAIQALQADTNPTIQKLVGDMRSAIIREKSKLASWQSQVE